MIRCKPVIRCRTAKTHGLKSLTHLCVRLVFPVARRQASLVDKKYRRKVGRLWSVEIELLLVRTARNEWNIQLDAFLPQSLRRCRVQWDERDERSSKYPKRRVHVLTK